MNKTNSFSVASYNIYFDRYPASGNKPTDPDRISKMAEQLLQDQFSIIALQEVSPEAHETLANTLRSKYYHAYYQHPGRPEGVCLLAKIDEFEWKNTTALDIAGGDKKGVNSASLVHRATGKTVFIATSHFKGGPPGNANKPGREVGDLELGEVLRLSENQPHNLNIVTGDFNQEAGAPQNNRIELIAKQQFGFQEQMNGSYPTEPFTGRRIDATVYKSDSQTSVTVQTELASKADNYARLSDHLPWIQTFTFNNIQQLQQPTPPTIQAQSAHKPLRRNPVLTTVASRPTSTQQATLPTQRLPNPIPQKAPSPPNPPQPKGLRRFLNSIWDGMASFFRYLFGSFFKKP